MRIRDDENGQVLVLTCLCMGILIGFLALAIDVGLLFRAKRNLQVAADAAATAATLDYFYNYSSANAVSAAQSVGTTAANANGVTASAGGPTITINAGGGGHFSTPWHDANGYFEAVLTEPSPTAFMGYFGFHSVNIVARAVAGAPGQNQSCMYILNPTGDLGPGNGGDSTMYLQGSFNLNAPNCGIVIDGTAADTLQFTGAGGSLTAGSVSIVGGAGGQTGDSNPAPVTGVAPVTNPLQGITMPTPSGCTAPPGGTITGSIGTAGGTVCYTGNVTVSNATLNGTVIFSTGSVTFDGNVSSGTLGSTVDIVTGGMTENAGTVFNLSPPSTGTYANVVLMAPPANHSVFEFDFGNSHGALGPLSGSFNGIVYLPGADLFLHDSGGDHSGGLTINAQLIVGELDDQTATLNINQYIPVGPNNPMARIALVE